MNSNSTHPMREDVKQKHFSTALRETLMGACIQAPFFVERVLVLTPGAPQMIAVAGLPLSGFMQRSRHHSLRSCASQPLA